MSVSYPCFGVNPITGVGVHVQTILVGRMAGTVHTEAYKALMRKLVELRKEKGLSQADLAKLLGKPPSFVGKYELGERRLDVIETMVISGKLEADLLKLLVETGIDMPSDLS